MFLAVALAIAPCTTELHVIDVDLAEIIADIGFLKFGNYITEADTSSLSALLAHELRRPTLRAP